MKKIESFEEYQCEYQKSIQDPEGFWADKAQSFVWYKSWSQTLDWNFTDPQIKWFCGGQLNITENALDRHLEKHAEKTAFIWEPNDPSESTRKLTYQDLHDQVCQFANALKSIDVKKGDRVCLYMPMIPELAVAVLACARIGAIHSVVFAGFSAQSLANRINDAECKVLVTADGIYRGSKVVPLKKIADEALKQCSCVQTSIVYQRTKQKVEWCDGRDLWWHDVVQNQSSVCKPEVMDSEDPLFILYTSGSTGKPKGILHSTAGYMVYAEYSFRNVFQYKDNDIYWCTADIGWITGHTYIVYGPLLACATSVMFEGVPTYPDAGRFWQVVEKHKVNIFYTAPTAIRALEAKGLEFVTPYNLSSLKVLGTVGEPINQEAWDWYNENIGQKNCPIVDTWWQTETGGILISPLAHITATKPTFATLPLPGVQLAILDKDGKEIEETEAEGNLCIKFPWPSMLRSIFGDHKRCYDTYFSMYQNYYFTGDGCKRDVQGYYRITGRVDDVINVSGHRLGTAEIENTINQHEDIVESAVVGYPHPIKGQGIYAYVICQNHKLSDEELKKQVVDFVSQVIGPIAKPDVVQVVPELPKTRSGKIMRRILRKIAAKDTSNLGDVSTLLNPEIVEMIKESLHS